jgi:large repetitive protein
VNDFILHSDGNGGTDVVFEPGPVIHTDQFSLSQNGNSTIITGLSVSDALASPGDNFAISAFTEEAFAGSTVTPSTGSGTLAAINAALANVTYTPGATLPSSDMVTLTVTDNKSGFSDTVNFVFNEAGASPATLFGTPGKDVIFATGNNDTLSGAGGQDQFVFKPTSLPPGQPAVEHTITDFNPVLDTLDVRQFAGITASNLPTWAADTHNANDTLVTLDANDTVLLKNVSSSSLHASDFLVHT